MVLAVRARVKPKFQGKVLYTRGILQLHPPQPPHTSWEPWEKLSRAMFIPALIISLRRSTERDAGPETREPSEKVIPNLTNGQTYLHRWRQSPTQESFILRSSSTHSP